MKTTILIIEDSLDLLSDITEMLSIEGYETLSASNGEQGIEIAEKELPDLIVCDIRMPLMDGYGVLEHVRNSERTQNIPFIFLTARTGRSEIREGMRLGADDYLTKPFTAEELVSSVNSRLARRNISQNEAEQKMETLRRSITLALPHEMRTPLNAILGFSEILMSDADSLDESQTLDMAKHINEAAKRLYHLIENYVIYANLELMQNDNKRRELLQNGRTEYSDIVMTQEMQQIARHHNREDDLTVNVDTVEQAIAISPDNFSRIIQEIADNAFKFSKKGDPVEMRAHRDGNFIVIEIQDGGYGMQPTEIESIGAYMQFKRAFFEQQGIGFGLTIASRMAELHGGKLEVESERGKTTTVTILLPLVQ